MSQAAKERLTLQEFVFMVLLYDDRRNGRNRSTSWGLRNILREAGIKTDACCEEHINGILLPLQHRGLVNGDGTGDREGPLAPSWRLTESGLDLLTKNPLFVLFAMRLRQG